MSAPTIIPPPDLSSRPHAAAIARSMAVPASELFTAWTSGLDRWLAAPGTVIMMPEPGALFFFETHHGPFRAPYHGRVLRVESGRLLELAWVSIGTGGMETVVTVELEPEERGTLLRLAHAGFADAQLADEHRQAWLVLLDGLETIVTSGGSRHA